MNSKLIGLSQVVVGNNKGAAVNAIVRNSLEQSKEDGLDISEVEKAINTVIETNISAEHTEEVPAKSETEEKTEEAEIKTEDTEIKTEEDKEKQEQNNKNEETHEMTFVTIKNSRDFPLAVTYKNAAGEEVETVLEAGKTVDVSEDQKEAVEAQVSGAEAPKVDNSADIEKAVNAAISAASAKFEDKIAKMQEAFDKAAQEPAFVPAGKETKAENAFATLDYKERHAKQINAAWEYLKLGNINAAKTLNELNEVNLEALKAAEKVSNNLSISDFGNFVISPELLTEIQGYRNDYSALVNATDWRETLSLEFAWLRRSGDIDMQNVELDPGTGDGNLKPISEYTAEPVISKLEELAAVTPVCNSATRFLAVDLLGDVARGYRNDYDRKRAQLVIARLQQAVTAHGAHSIPYTATPHSADSLTSWVQLWATVAQTVINGTFIFNMSTFATIQKAAVDAGANGPLSGIFLTGDVPTIFGRPYIVVPNDLLPSLNSGQTVTFKVDGENVVVNHAVFYFDLSNFTGRTSGGMQYDLSTEAAYEVGGVVKSAYQRNELVLRGSFFRGGAILDDARVAGMTSAVAVSVS